MNIELLLAELRNNNVKLAIKEDKLICILPDAGIDQGLLNLLKEHKEEIKKTIEEKTNFKKYQTIEKSPEMEHYPLSPSQKRLWMLSQFEGGSQAYNMSYAIKLKGELPVILFEKSFKELIVHHEVLRTVFKVDNETQEVRQFIVPANEVDFTISQIDFSSESDHNEKLNHFINEKINEEFNLENAPLVRASLIKIAAREHIFLFSMHHIISDGLSMELLISEVVQRYDALLKGQNSTIAELKFQYKDYSVWLNAEMQKEKYKNSEKYWLDKLKGELPILNLPSFRQRPALQTFNGDNLSRTFSENFSNKLKVFSEENKATLFMTFMAGVKALLYRYSGQDDITAGIPIAGREHPDLANQIGLYINTLVIRTLFNETNTFAELLQIEKENLIAANEHQMYSFDELVRKINVKRDLSRSALFDVLVNFQNQSQLTLNLQEEISGLTLERYDFQKKSSQFDLSFNFSEYNNLITLNIEFNTDIYDASWIENVFNHFETFLSKAIEAKDTWIEKIDFLSQEEKNQILIAYNETTADYPREKTVVDLFREQAEKAPQNIALRDSITSYSYAELDEISEKIASYIHATAVENNKSPIAVLINRSAGMLAVLLGILKSGRPYIPLDPVFPEERLRYIIQNSGVKNIISQEEYSHIGSETSVILFEELFEKINDFKEFLPSQALASDTAYIIYTSGSTGNPKGVEISHRALLNFLTSIEQKPGINQSDVLFSVTTYSFDISILEFFVPLISGASLYVAEQQILANPHSVIEKLNEIQPTVIQATPSFYQMLFNADWQGSKILKVLCGGDLLNEELAKKLTETCSQVWNMYGPTETTIWSSLKQIEKPKDASNIGKPINNTQFYLLDKFLNPVAPGVVGAIYIGGDGLAKGYYKNETLTNQKFIKSPFVEGALIYETGDVGKWNEKGEIQFLGRNDNQVKIRGYRIELGDIETALSQYSDDLKQAVVAARELNSEKVLVVYYVSENDIEKTTLRAYLQGKLPEYMVPNIYVQLDALPLTPNGKIDRKALPDVDGENIARKEYIAPQSETEKSIAAIWENLLNLEIVGSTDDFFELGGHSILLTRLLSEYQRVFNISVNLKTLYTNTSLKDHAILVDNLKQDNTAAVFEIKKLENQHNYDLSPSQVRYWLLYKIQGKSQEFNIYSTQDLPSNLNFTVFQEAFNILIDRHEILRTVFVEDTGIPKQKVLSHSPLNIPAYQSESIIRNEIFEYEFDLEVFPLFKVGVLENNTGHTLYFNIHHIISDGWSIEVISRDLMHIYNALINGKKVELPELSVQYKDYAKWQNDQLQSSEINGYENYWKEKLSGSLPYLQLPSDYASKIKSGDTNSSSYTIYLDSVQKQKIEKLSKSKGFSTFTLFAATLKILLYRLTAEEDIIIGIPAANRNHFQLKDLAGCFINTLVLRDKISAEESFLSWLQQVNETIIDALTYQNYPFEKLLELLKISSDDNRFPLCPVFINMLDFDLEETQVITDFNPVHKILETSPKFDLECYVKTFSNGCVINCVYDHNLFKKETIEYWMEAYLSIIDQVVSNEQIAVKEIKIFENYMYQEEDAKPVNAFEYFESEEIEQSIPQRFEKQVKRFPEKTAVYANGVRLSYQTLNNCANHLAVQIKEKTNTDTKRIALLLDHNETCVIGMLGVLKAGYTYVPIDANSPLSRIQFIIEDSGCKHIVCNSLTLNIALQAGEEVQDLSIIKIDENYNLPEITISLQSIDRETEAYVLYTSGSTGMPKGVVQTQRNVLHYIRVYTNNTHISVDDNLSVFSTYTFDASVKDIYGAILNGAVVSIYNIVDKGLQALPDWLKTQNISIIHMVPTIYRNFLKGLAENEILPTIRLIDLGGESCHLSDIDLFKKHFAEGAFLVNDYGPTEATIVSQKFVNHNSQITRNNVPLGKSVVETSVFLLDENNNRKGVYQTGEITFKSDYLSLGYLNREEQTNKVFINNFESENTRIYKSGDIGRMLPTGEIEFLQRKDSQVKLNGLRIELSEIEYQLEKLESISEAVVLVNEVQNNNYITAYLKVKSAQGIDEIKTQLAAILPKYMVPSIYLILEEFPLTRTGKIDRNALPAPVVSDLKKVEYKAPKNELEKELTAIWAETLNLDYKEVGTENSFFELGGHSLVVSQIINRIHKQLNKHITFKDFFLNPTIAALSEKLNESDFSAIPNTVLSNSYALSASQKRLWILSQFEGGSQAYNMSYAVKLKGELNTALFDESFKRLIERHEILRTIFKYDSDTDDVRQFVSPIESINLDFEIVKFNSDSILEEEIHIDNYFQTKCSEEFDLEKAPLLKSAIVQTLEKQYVFFLSIHHIISDGWSMEVLVKEIVAIYNALAQGSEINLPELKIQYKDYAAWLNNETEKEKYKSAAQYWMDQFSGSIPVLEIPSSKNRPLVKTYSGDNISHTFSVEFLKKVNTFSAKYDATLFMTLVTGINLLLHKYSGQDDIIIGTPIAGRDHADLENQIGIYLNTLALRTNVNQESSVLDLLDFEKKMILASYEHQIYPFDELVEKLELKRDTSRSALFDVMIVFQSQSKLSSFKNENQKLENIEVERYDLKREVSKFDLTFEFVEEDELQLRINYNTDIYDSTFIYRLLSHFEVLVSKMAEKPEQKIKHLDYVTAQEKTKVLYDFNATKAVYQKETIVKLFENQTELTPSVDALTFDGISLNYKELNEKSNQFARYLKHKYKLQSEDKAGIKMNRSEKLVISILAVLKSGGAYVPIDSAYPQERIDFIEKDSNCKVIIDEAEWINFDAAAAHYSSDNLDENIRETDSAYVIYTSGSTGNPKGVEIAHASLTNYLLWGKEYYSAGGAHSLDFGLFTSLSFDLTVTSLFLPIISGGKLTVFETTDDVSKLLTSYFESGISSIKLTPAHISILESLDIKQTAVKLAIVGGEALLENQVRILQNLNPEIRIINEYGPTEATVGCIIYDVKNAAETVLIGKPIANTQIYILDESLNPCAVGVTGELYIAGDGLARGYINRAELTAEKFISNPFKEGALMYKTGDLGRWLADGNIDYTGRIDDQVKIRGYRIELGEIENCLSNINGISHSVAAVKESGNEKYLTAYYVSDSVLDKNMIQSELSRMLPDYMLPSYYIQLDAIPLTTNGKVDKRQLPDVGESDLIKTEYIAPRSMEEVVLSLAWSHVLKYENIGVKDNFYNLGGDSIKSILVISRLKQQGYTLKVEQILKTPILEDLAKMLSVNQITIDQSVVKGDVLLTPIQHYFLNDETFPNKNYYNQSVVLKCNGTIDSEILDKCIGALTAHHDALRMVYQFENDSWKQSNADISGKSYKIAFYDLQGEADELAAMKTIGEELQSSIDITSGVLFHIGHFRLSDGDRLALIIHHLVIDGVSWRILLEDLSNLYESYQTKTTFSLPLKTDSFQHWASLQNEFAKSSVMQQERVYWEQYSENQIPDFPVDFKTADSSWNLDKENTFLLNNDLTELLKTKVHQAYNTEINDILLTGLALAVRDVFDIEKSVIAMEGHGREEIIEGTDVGRTVGWFTTIYPFVLDLTNAANHELVTTKELLRKVPNKGIGYGILKYLDNSFQNQLQPAIQFNYLGDFSENNEEDAENKFFSFSSESIGLPLAAENTRGKILLDITGMMVSNGLSISIRYSADCYDAETIKKLNQSYKENLENLITELASIKQKHLTASDLTYKKITNSVLEELNKDNSIEDVYELSPLQQGLYYHWLVNRESPLYLEQFSYSLQSNKLDIELVEKAFNKLIERYPILRTSFSDSIDDVLLQIVHKKANGNFSYEKISPSESELTATIEKIKEEDRNKGFDLHTPSIMRLKVIETNRENECVFIWSHHHILMDGWCVSILVNDFYRILMALSSDQNLVLPEPVKYSTYIEWLSKIDKNESLLYWKNYLNGVETLSEIPFRKKNNSKNEKPVYDTKELVVDGELFQRINKFNHTIGITWSSYIQGVWGYLLSRYSGTNDVLFGTVVSGRPGDLPGVENIVGLFSNTIPVRVSFKENDTPASFLKQLHSEMLDSTPHHYLNLSEVQAESSLGMGLINNIIVFENFLVQDAVDDEIESLYNEDSRKLTIGKVDFADQTNYDFHTTVAPSDTWLKIEFRFNSNVFNPDSIEYLKSHFLNILDQFSKNTETLNLNTIDYLDSAEKTNVLYDFNNTESDYSKTDTVISLFKEQAEKTPQNIALEFEGKGITYQELDLFSDRLAAVLIENYDVQTGDFVGIQLNRSEWTLISILGILKAGATYIPIDSELPDDRKAFIFEDAALKLLITETAFIFDLDFDGNIFSIDVEFDPSVEIVFEKPAVSPQNLAYVIYTSGSTGNPKGVEIAHASLTNYLLWGKEYYSAGGAHPLDFGLFTSLSFDLTVTSLFLPIISGGKLTVFETTDDISKLLTSYFESNISSIKLTPAHISILESLDIKQTAVKLAIVGGEALLENQVRILQNLNPEIRIINEYGPTEATVGCIIYDVKNAAETVLIGKPIANTQIYILDESLNPCAVGVTGELYIAGDGLARGYINRAELTAEKFIPNPFKEGALMYKTGDLGRWLADGNIDYTGRIDDQVKIRGYRIELGEIENCLSNINGISHSVAVVKE
ncbi:amino acid adenylation domain-containing protein, partial [Flavobacterium sp.]|uniref:amino acid adenylation domain-containing protein n=1 Tax=Flavobacterium sp. TaxID=239 RepID=UPI0031DF772D